MERFPIVNTENLKEVSDYAGVKRDFRRLFGFEVDGVRSEEAVEVEASLD